MAHASGGNSDQHKVPRAAESLGWLTQSALPPKKQKIIEGVSAGPLVNLKAQLYKTQEEARLVKEGKLDPSERSSRSTLDGLGGRNRGVEERDKRDKLHVKSVENRANESYAALQRKAELYEKLTRGEIDDDDEQYNVDFLYKSYNERSNGGDEAAAVDTVATAVYNSGGLLSEDMACERECRAWEQEQRQQYEEETAREERRREQREMVNEIAAETEAGRDRVANTKKRKQQLIEDKRESSVPEETTRENERGKTCEQTMSILNIR